jgi:hypothetical protein
LLQFWLGSHQPAWLARTDAPLCVSLRRLADRKTLPRAVGPVFLDGGGFTEVSQYGRWRCSARDYATTMQRMCAEIGNVRHAAIMDWMCEPFVLTQTGLTIAEHHARTIDSYGELLALAPDVPWLPVLQGWHRADYLRHLELYDREGFDLRTVPLVGVGSICRRQHTDEASLILARLAQEGLLLHGFGLKLQGLLKAAGALVSADSMAWSFHARRLEATWCGSETHKNCANCLPFALHWRSQVLDLLAKRGGSRQLALAV